MRSVITVCLACAAIVIFGQKMPPMPPMPYDMKPEDVAKQREERLAKMTPEEREAFLAREQRMKQKRAERKAMLEAMTPEERKAHFEKMKQEAAATRIRNREKKRDTIIAQIKAAKEACGPECYRVIQTNGVFVGMTKAQYEEYQASGKKMGPRRVINNFSDDEKAVFRARAAEKRAMTEDKWIFSPGGTIEVHRKSKQRRAAAREKRERAKERARAKRAAKASTVEGKK